DHSSDRSSAPLRPAVPRQKSAEKQTRLSENRWAPAVTGRTPPPGYFRFRRSPPHSGNHPHSYGSASLPSHTASSPGPPYSHSHSPTHRSAYSRSAHSHQHLSSRQTYPQPRRD